MALHPMGIRTPAGGGWVAPALSGLLLSLAFPTAPDHPMAWAHGSPWAFVALLPLFSCLPRPTWKEGFRCGWVTGFVFSLYSLYWVAFTQGGGPAVVAGTLLMAGYIGLFYGLAGAGISTAVKAWPHAGWLAAALLWTGAEYLLSLGELGFPWLLLGSTQAVTVELIQYAEITGVYGVSFWAASVNAVLWLTLRASGLRPRLAGAAALLALFACPWWYSTAVIDSTPGEPGIRVGLVQNNLGLEKWHSGGLERSFTTLEQLSRAAAAQGPDLLVWPETAVPCQLRTREDCSGRVEELVAELGVPVLTGASDADPHTREPYNAAFYFTADRAPQRYAKMHLVPFGERTPFMDYVPLLRDIDWTALTGDLGPAEFARGRERTLFKHPGGDFAVLICFESVFPDLVRRHVAAGADFLVVITNDSWFGRTAGPYQHAQLAVFRAVENRTAIARCATSGVSLFVDPYGRTSQSTPIFTEAHAVGGLATGQRRTFYNRRGDLFARLVTGAAFLAAMAAIPVSRRAAQES
ncbi:MAG: apolipoprotein N-acyltransferase [Gemmatimonadetes bacterium]|nr:apolipoprotein N-acyltransferase [Gemmatimonadota bacterium]